METSRKQLVDALCDVLDGYNIWDIQQSTGLGLDRCVEIRQIADAVKQEWLKKE